MTIIDMAAPQGAQIWYIKNRFNFFNFSCINSRKILEEQAELGSCVTVEVAALDSPSLMFSNINKPNGLCGCKAP